MTFLIDTHSHFDDPKFRNQQLTLADKAVSAGVRHLLITGITQATFTQIIDTQALLNQHSSLRTHIALGLHPAFIKQHQLAHLDILEQHIQNDKPIALGELGLDTYEPWLKQAEIYQQQQLYFMEQLNLAVAYELPVLLHIRKAHGDALKILKQHQYDAHQLGGIAHSFSGGLQEAKAFVKLGFKLGITGQINNPKAKKLRKAISAVVAEYGIDCLVIETDCPDMLPWSCRQSMHNNGQQNSLQSNQLDIINSATVINEPANLIHILTGLSRLLGIAETTLAKQLWHNSCHALRQTHQQDWHYPALST